MTDNTALAPGQTVWVRIGGHLVGKLSSRYAGPYTVVRRNQSGLYVLLSASGVQLSRAVRRDRIKLQRTSSVVDDISVFRVETILTRLGASGTEFLVKWVGYPVSDTDSSIGNLIMRDRLSTCLPSRPTGLHSASPYLSLAC